MVILAAFATSTISLFDVPARRAFVIEMVGKRDLMNAIAQPPCQHRRRRPAVAGVLIGIAGVPICFPTGSYLAAIVAAAHA
jgi:hypothetical protein